MSGNRGGDQNALPKVIGVIVVAALLALLLLFGVPSCPKKEAKPMPDPTTQVFHVGGTTVYVDDYGSDEPFLEIALGRDSLAVDSHASHLSLTNNEVDIQIPWQVVLEIADELREQGAKGGW